MTKIDEKTAPLDEYDIRPLISDPWADRELTLKEYGIKLIENLDILSDVDCIIVAVGHREYRNMSMMQMKELFRKDRDDSEKVLIDVKSLYRIDELRASGIRFWRL